MIQRGFTIVELIIVIVVLGILTTLAVFGSSAVLEQTRNNEALSKVATITSALEKYYSKNNEYPSAVALAAGGNGRSLTSTQYATTAQLLSVPADVLQTGTYKFVPCAAASSLCCTVSGGQCPLPASDGTSRSIFYMTRSSTQASDGTALGYVSPLSSCVYTLNASDTAADDGYSAYYLMYRDYTNSNAPTSWKVFHGDRGKHSRTAGCQIAN